MFFKVISFDCEILPLRAQMPNPETCPVLLVSFHLNYDYLIKDVDVKTRNIVFILTKGYEKIEIRDNKVVYFFDEKLKGEKRLLRKTLDLIKENDVITGYNISGFDIPYILDRCKILGIKDLYVGLNDKRLWYDRNIAKGFSVTKIYGLAGKIMFDVLSLLKREDESNVFKKKYNLKVTTLRHVSKEILGIEKLDYPVEDMQKYWDDSLNVELRNRFIDYCSRDSELPLLLLTRFRLLDKFMTLSKASGRLVQEIINSQGSGVMVENLLLKEFRKYDRVLPMRKPKVYKDEEEEEELQGAEVFEPVLGISEDVCSVDYASLYPTLMIKYNLCYSTIIKFYAERAIVLKDLGLTENDVETMYDEYGNAYATFVRKEKFRGIVPNKLLELLDARASQKKEMKKYEKGSVEYIMWDATQNATKILLNSHYGYSGDEDAKIYDLTVATAVTTNGRLQIKKTWNIITEEIGKVKIGEREFGLGITQGDTDSSYMQVIALDKQPITRDEAIQCVNFVLEKVNANLEKPMKLAFENYIKRIIILAKKHYAYLSVDDKGKEAITSKGIETIRRDWCNFSTSTMSKIIDYILNEKEVPVGIQKGVAIVKEQAKLLNSDEVNKNSLILSKRLTKPITMYDNLQVHVMVAIKMKERGQGSEVGDRIQYIIINNGKKLINEKAEEAEYTIKHDLKIDKQYYLLHQLIPPAMRVLGLLGVNEEILLSQIDEGQMHLDKWFGTYTADNVIDVGLSHLNINFNKNKWFGSEDSEYMVEEYGQSG